MVTSYQLKSSAVSVKVTGKVAPPTSTGVLKNAFSARGGSSGNAPATYSCSAKTGSRMRDAPGQLPTPVHPRRLTGALVHSPAPLRGREDFRRDWRRPSTLWRCGGARRHRRRAGRSTQTSSTTSRGQRERGATCPVRTGAFKLLHRHSCPCRQPVSHPPLLTCESYHR